MDSSLPKSVDFPPNVTLPPKEDLLGDFDDLKVTAKVETSAKPDIPEPKPVAIKTDNLLDTFSEPTTKIDPVSKIDPLSEIDPLSKIDPLSEPNFPIHEITNIKVADFNISDVHIPEIKAFNSDEDPLKLGSSPEPTDFLDEPEEITDPLKVDEAYGFNKPLPPEPIQQVTDFLKSETTNGGPTVHEDKDDDLSEFVGARGDSSPTPFSREESPLPPPIPKHQNLRDDSPDRFESSPEPDFKPMDSAKEIPEPEPEPVLIKSPPPKQEEPIQTTTTVKETPVKKPTVGDIGAKDIIVEIDAWFNPARLHPQVESLVYWRDPRKSGAVFGVLMVTLLSLTTFSLISVIAYLGLITLFGTISFRVYKNIMQAVQKTSDGHPFKELLQLEISLPEDKVAELSRVAAQQLNTAISFLRSLFLVEDLIDSIKGLVLFWALTYIGAIFNGLTLLIIGVILVFALPRLYEKNKTQVDAYIQIGMDKLSIVTNRMKAAIPSAKKEEKPKEQ